MEEAMREEADRWLEEALKRSGARDPRDLYRESLRELRRSNARGYDRAVDHFQTVLVPSIASGRAEPLQAWREYGRLLAEAVADGRTVAIDGTGRAHPYEPDAPMDWLILHLPEAKTARALAVSLPAEPTQAQRATYELLVKGSHRMPEGAQGGSGAPDPGG
jgi:hypothetical protein